jgi:hypothetical protein
MPPTAAPAKSALAPSTRPHSLSSASAASTYTSTAGTANNPMRWLVALKASRYTMSTSQWSRRSPAGSSPQCTASHSTRAMENRLNVYTFSFTTDWFHTVNEVAPTSAPAKAAPIRAHRTSGTMSRRNRSATRNSRPAARALVTAANRLIRRA